jgi:ATP-dependent Clp protease protease subunit
MLDRALRWLTLLSLAAACAAVAWMVSIVWRHVEDPYWVMQTWVDAEVDAGAPAAAIDPADPLLRRRLIVITASINERSAAHVIPRLHYLAQLDAKAPIDLVVSTTGGWRDSAFAIIDTMRMISAPVNTWAIGGCYSAGTLIVAGGTGTRSATRDALLMVHANLEASDDPFAQEGREFTREQRFWKERAHLPIDWALDSGDSYYLTAAEAEQFGIVDVVRE